MVSENKKSSVPWLEKYQITWQKQLTNNQIPHALMLNGNRGIGKRLLAEWMVRSFFSGHKENLSYPINHNISPDFHWLAPENGKMTISVDQVRSLINELAKTSYLGNGKAAIIEPANAMTINAKNSLLKTLEEPSDKTLIIVIVDKMQHIPVTIRSRCQQLNIKSPSKTEALSWLDEIDASKPWVELADHYTKTPLLAIENSENLEKMTVFKKQLTDVIFKKESPVKVAALWAKDDCQFILDWFGHFVSQLIYFVSLRESFPEIEKQYPYLNKLATRDLFCFLDGINKVRHQAFGSYNTQMIFEAFLVDWSESLHSCNRDNADLNSLPSNIFKL
tara:strand:+ start:1189 stop:2190 length:1002 start_codon:yes stop_codon:yes gene_type:complete